MLAETTGLTSIKGIKPIYVLPTDPFIEDVLIPGFKVASAVDCMVGFFKSSVLASLAPGIATFVNRHEGQFRLVVSPILSSDDWEAIQSGQSSTNTIIESMFSELAVTEDLIERFTLECLAWLIRKRRVDIQVALVKDALFHPKVWLFRDDCGSLMAAHGSSNLTNAGIEKNIEQVAVSRSWGESTEIYTATHLDSQFSAFWTNSREDCIVVPISEAVRDQLIRTYSTPTPPKESDLNALYQKAQEESARRTPEIGESEPDRFMIPAGLRYAEGPFGHQGEAVTAWCDANHRGVLEMATGAGKTITAMICAYRLHQLRSPLLIVVAAPYVPLIQQWCEEIRPFGITPVDLTAAHGPRGRARELRRLRLGIRNGGRDVAAVVVSHDTLTNPGFHRELERFEATTLLIGDEVHGLGSEGFTSNPPGFFDYRLGLSATPIRQYDEEGTEALLDFFGPIVYKFTLEQAIGTCLVPYDYYVHPVELNDLELDRWYALTERIRKIAWMDDESPGLFVQKLLRDRRAILENAENKIQALAEVLGQEDLRTLGHTLIYASDKAPDQLDRVNATLRDLGIRFHQLTSEETGDRKRTNQILDSFQRGQLQVLTAKRVLDEGVNIPQIQKAFILASTTVERQWVQRRGRLLRKCDQIGKTHGEIHDFVALPSRLSNLDRDARRLVESELKRVQEFARLARNVGLPGGPLETIEKLVEAVYL